MRRNGFNLAMLASATLISQGLQFLALPVVSRLYSPGDFGGASVAIGVSLLVGSLATGRLELALPTASNKRESANIIALAFTLICLVTGAFTVASVLVWLHGCYVCTVQYNLPLLILGPVAFAYGVYTLGNNALLRQKQFKHFAANKLLQGFGTAASQILIGVVSPTPAALLVGQMIGYLAGAYNGWGRLKRSVLVVLRNGLGALREPWKKLRYFPLYLGTAALFNLASQYVPVFGFAAAFGLHEAGIFAFAFRVALAPLAVVGSTISQFFAAEFRSFEEKSPTTLHKRYLLLLSKMFAASTVFCVAVVGVIWILSVNDVFGAPWRTVGKISILLLPVLIVDLAVAPLSAIMAYLNRNELQLAWDVGRLLSLVSVFLVRHMMSLGFEATVLLFSCVFAAGMGIHAVLVFLACRSKALSALLPKTEVGRE